MLDTRTERCTCVASCCVEFSLSFHTPVLALKDKEKEKKRSEQQRLKDKQRAKQQKLKQKKLASKRKREAVERRQKDIKKRKLVGEKSQVDAVLPQKHVYTGSCCPFLITS